MSGRDPVRISRLGTDDVLEVVAVHLAAFPGFFLTALGSRFLAEYYRAFVSAPGSVAWVAKSVDDRVIGFVVGSRDPSGFYHRLFRARWWAFGLAALPAIMRDPRRLSRVLRGRSHDRDHSSNMDGVGLFSLGVTPLAQGMGVGRQLVTSFIEHARAVGGRTIQLTTDAESNDAVLRFYEAMGFATHRDFATPDGRRMFELRLDLEPTPLTTTSTDGPLRDSC